MIQRTFFTLTLIFLIGFKLAGQTFGTFTDTRDSKSYKTVHIGTQTWMAENLAFKTEKGCYAYDKNETNTKIFGYLYAWTTAQVVCPSGWHLPSKDEWATLVSFLGGDDNASLKLMEKGNNHWTDTDPKVTNETGFSGLPGGGCETSEYSSEVKFYEKGVDGRFWSSTGGTGNNELMAWEFILIYEPGQKSIDRNSKDTGASVRCILDK